MNDEDIQTIEQVKQVLKGSDPLEFEGGIDRRNDTPGLRRSGEVYLSAPQQI